MSKTFVRFFTIADFEEEENWLREQHKAGLKLVKMTPPCWFTFEETTPEDVIYRLDYKNQKLTEEYTQMFADFGWEYAGKCVGWYYFRKPAAEACTPEEEELFSDNASKAEMIKHVIVTRLLPLLVIFICCVIPNFMRYAGGEGSGPAVTVGVIFFSLMFLLYMYLLVHCGRKFRKLKEKYMV